ncbi:nuclear transport factor 2 family protein [Parasphingorhabdus sp.]|uniref:nuclear transport factor 2 family protein n=1 Tax=Parasphingorhabdus sp. TaxID=2709688 RepID=UPI002F944C6E
MSVRESLKIWHERFAEKRKNGGKSADINDPGLSTQIADDAVFHSPVVHTPQVGKPIVMAYLSAADTVLGNDSFRYVREIVDDSANMAMLEFMLELDGIEVNGVDIITWNEDGLIQDFKVMVRPLKAINKVWEEMGKILEKMKG